MTDWLGNQTQFGYDAKSNLTSIGYPSSTNGWAEDLGPYDAAGNFNDTIVGSASVGTTETHYPPNPDDEFYSKNDEGYTYNAQNRLSGTVRRLRL